METSAAACVGVSSSGPTAWGAGDAAANVRKQASTSSRIIFRNSNSMVSPRARTGNPGQMSFDQKTQKAGRVYP